MNLDVFFSFLLLFFIFPLFSSLFFFLEMALETPKPALKQPNWHFRKKTK